MNKQIYQYISILVISLFLGLSRYFFIDDEYPIFNNKLNAEVININNDSIDYVKEFLFNLTEPELIDINFAKSIYDNDLGIFIDARDNLDFINGHINKSINIPFEVENNYSLDLLDSLMTQITINEKFLVVYCSGSGCTLGEDLVYSLYEEHNFYSLVYFEEGFPIWEELDYPIKTGNKVNEKSTYDKNLFNYTVIDIVLIFSFVIVVFLYFSNGFKEYLIIFSRLVVGFIFIYFSYDKILDPIRFAELASNYDIIPYNLEYLGALILPWIEMIVGLCLLLGIFLEVSTSYIIAMLLFFIFMIGQAYLRGKSIDCGCLLTDLNNDSSLEKRIYMLKRIVQDLYFLLLTLIIRFKNKIL